MIDVNKMPSLEVEAGMANSRKSVPVIEPQIIAGIAIGIVIAVSN